MSALVETPLCCCGLPRETPYVVVACHNNIRVSRLASKMGVSEASIAELNERKE